MSAPWTSGCLRGGTAPTALFGYMHEDPAPECSLANARTRALCVLSAGDMAFALLRAGAAEVTAADPNPGQHDLVQWKLEAAAAGMDLEQAVRSGAVSRGRIDARLRFIARWIKPLVPAGSFRWQAAWRLLRFGIAMTFSAGYRAHLPADVIARLKRRMETALQSAASKPSPWLDRMMASQASLVPDAWGSTWPDPGWLCETRLKRIHGTLQDAVSHEPWQLVAASNILDTCPPHDAPLMLSRLGSQMSPGGVVVIRSLFREEADWPPPPEGWHVDADVLSRLAFMDRSPLCRVSVVYRCQG